MQSTSYKEGQETNKLYVQNTIKTKMKKQKKKEGI